MLKKDGILVEKYDYIKEYRLNKNGSLTMTTPAMEILEYPGSHGPIYLVYLTGADMRTTRNRYEPNTFWELKKSTNVFRFKKEVPDEECRTLIVAELNRRASEIDKKIVEYQKRAANLRSQAEKIKQ